MTRAFDRRGGYQGGSKPVGELMPPPAKISSAAIRPVKEEPVSLDLDCMCEKNDPNCAECWVPNKQFAPNTDWAGKDLGKFRLVDDGRAELRTVSDFDRDVRYRFDECLELLLRKHKAYGPSNIGNAPGGPLNGLQVRIHDKLARINNLIATGHKPDSEPLRDSFLDLANYSVIALMVLDDAWPSA